MRFVDRMQGPLATTQTTTDYSDSDRPWFACPSKKSVLATRILNTRFFFLFLLHRTQKREEKHIFQDRHIYIQHSTLKINIDVNYCVIGAIASLVYVEIIVDCGNFPLIWEQIKIKTIFLTTNGFSKNNQITRCLLHRNAPVASAFHAPTLSKFRGWGHVVT